MRQLKPGKITASVTLEINQLERLNEVAQGARVSRSTIVRKAIERELKRYEKISGVDSSPRTPGSGVVAQTAPHRP